MREIFAEPLHPYTQLLIASLPSLEEKGSLPGHSRAAAVAAQSTARLPVPPPLPERDAELPVENPPLREVRPGSLGRLPCRHRSRSWRSPAWARPAHVATAGEGAA